MLGIEMSVQGLTDFLMLLTTQEKVEVTFLLHLYIKPTASAMTIEDCDEALTSNSQSTSKIIKLRAT